MAAEVRSCPINNKDKLSSLSFQALANRVSEQDLSEGRLYPPLDTIRDCSTAIAAYIAEHAYKNGINFDKN